MAAARTPRSLLLTVVLCSSLVAGRASAQKPPKPERDLITREELAEADAKSPDLYQAIRRLRPRFLEQSRGTRSMGVRPGSGSAPMCNAARDPNCAQRRIVQVPVPPVIYLDGMKSGDPEVLKGIRTGDVEEVRYLSPTQAEMDYGPGHEGGVVLVKLHKGKKP